MISKALVSVIAVSAAVVPAAQAHTLSKTAAKQEAKKVGAALAHDLGGLAPSYACTRRGDHKVDCQISLVTLDGAACSTVIRVFYSNHRDKKISRKVLDALDCSPPEIPIL